MPVIAGMTLYQICWYFLIYSVIGWVIEVIYHAVTLGKVINRGFLNGPVCPVYGFGMLAVFAMINTLGSFGGSLSSSQETNVWVIFISGTVLASAVELIAGWLLLHLFHARWWDYSDKPFNLGGYICPQFSLLWGMGAVLVVRVFHPGIERMSAAAIPERIGWPVLGVCYVLYIADLIVTVLIVIGLNKRLAELDELRRRMRIVSNAMSETIAEQAISTTVFVEKQQVQASLAKAEFKDRTASARSDAKEIASSVKSSAAARVNEAQSALVQRSRALKKALTKHRIFGARRLLKAFPNMRHSQYAEALKELFEDLK